MDTEKILQAMGERILLRRKQLRMTQEELAEKMDVTTQMISYAEAGKKAMRPENLIKLCAALDVSSDYILTGKVRGEESARVADKLSALSREQLSVVERVIDCCLELVDSD